VDCKNNEIKLAAKPSPPRGAPALARPPPAAHSGGKAGEAQAMAASEFRFAASDGHSLFARRWLPAAPPRAAVQIAHGLVEHSARYTRFAAALNRAGFAVYANDHRGHGQTGAAADLGFLAASDGWRSCLDDLWTLNRQIAAENPGLPIVFFGHSMGSILGRGFAAAHGEALAALILSGANGKPPAAAALAPLIARFERWRLGPRGQSKLLKAMMFGAFNKPFAPARSEYDWLSRDPAEVDAYVADPLCGYDFSTQLVIDLLGGLAPLLAPSELARIPKRLPIYVMSGGRDPVGADIASLIDAYRSAGLAVTARVYPEARHELLNETNRDEVAADLVAWLDGVLPGPGEALTATAEASAG
jgi:alpha-beta hydrolase superfamily lysophospholipase